MIVMICVALRRREERAPQWPQNIVFGRVELSRARQGLFHLCHTVLAFLSTHSIALFSPSTRALHLRLVSLNFTARRSRRPPSQLTRHTQGWGFRPIPLRPFISPVSASNTSLVIIRYHCSPKTCISGSELARHMDKEEIPKKDAISNQ